MKMILLLMMLLLAACKGETTGGDGFYFEDNATRINPHPTITIKLYENEFDVARAYLHDQGQKEDFKTEGLFGFASYNNKICVVHIVDPAINYRPAELGHEITHCLYGNFHKSQG